MKFAKCGAFAFKEKGRIKEEIDSLESSLASVVISQSGFDEIVIAMNARIKMQTEVAPSMDGSEFYPLGYANALEKYILCFARQLRRGNTIENQYKETIKDLLDELIIDNAAPIEIADVIKLLFSLYPDKYPQVQGPAYVSFVNKALELLDEGRIRKICGSGASMIVESTKTSHGIPSQPMADDVLLPLSDLDKLSFVESVKKEKGDSYNEYIQQLAKKYGWEKVRAYYLKAVNSTLQKEALSAMSAFANAGVAYSSSQKGSAAIRGGIANAIAGPIAGVLVAYRTEMDNREKEKRRIHAEISRNQYVAQNKQDKIHAFSALDQLDLIDYQLLIKDIS